MALGCVGFGGLYCDTTCLTYAGKGVGASTVLGAGAGNELCAVQFLHEKISTRVVEGPRRGVSRGSCSVYTSVHVSERSNIIPIGYDGTPLSA